MAALRIILEPTLASGSHIPRVRTWACYVMEHEALVKSWPRNTERACPTCGQAFMATEIQQYCSNTCRWKAHRRRQAVERQKANRALLRRTP